MIFSNFFKLQKNANPPNEQIKDKVASLILEHLVSEGKVTELSSNCKAPYDNFKKISQSKS